MMTAGQDERNNSNAAEEADNVSYPGDDGLNRKRHGANHQIRKDNTV
jgi:hypothetical protein